MNASRIIILALILAVVAYVLLLNSSNSAQQGTASNLTTRPVIQNSGQNPNYSSSASNVNAGSSSTSTAITDKYLMAFLACSGPSCNDPRNHMTYLAQSNNLVNWTLVSGFKPFSGSVPDLVRRGDMLYIYNPGTLTTLNLSTGEESQTKHVELMYPNRTQAIFVDPCPILINNTIVLFFLPGMYNQDPAQCPGGESSCVKQIMSATEINGSDGLDFVIDPGVRVNIGIDTLGGTASDPAVFKANDTYVLYASVGQGVVAYTSNSLQGAYSQINGLPGNMLVEQGIGGVPSGYYDNATGKYYTYTGTGTIDVAITDNITTPISKSSFLTAISGCNTSGLGCAYDTDGVIGSPGVIPNIANSTR